MDAAALIALCGLLLIKEAGVPIPIPGDLLVLGAGIAAAGPGLPAPTVLAAVLVAGYVGGSLQFVLVRGALRRIVLAVLGRVGVGQARLDQLTAWLAQRGSRGVAVARATPAVRVGAIAASGLANMPYPVFLLGLLAGNGLFVGAHFVLGYLVGPPAGRLVAGLGSLALGVVALVVLSAIGAVGWRAIRARRQRSGASEAAPGGAAGWVAGGAAGWVDAGCPACLLLTVARQGALDGREPSRRP